VVYFFVVYHSARGTMVIICIFIPYNQKKVRALCLKVYYSRHGIRPVWFRCSLMHEAGFKKRAGEKSIVYSARVFSNRWSMGFGIVVEVERTRQQLVARQLNFSTKIFWIEEN